MAQQLTPFDIPIPQTAKDPGVRAGRGANAAMSSTQLFDPGDAAGKAMSGFANDLSQIGAVSRHLFEQRQAAEDQVFSDHSTLTLSNDFNKITDDFIKSPDAAKPDADKILDRLLAERQKTRTEQMRSDGNFVPSQSGLESAAHSAMQMRIAAGRQAITAGNNQRIGLLSVTTTENLDKSDAIAAQTGDLQGGLARATKLVRPFAAMVDPAKYMQLRREALGNTAASVAHGYLERGEFDKLGPLLDRNRVFVGAEQEMARVAVVNNEDPAMVVAFNRIESSGRNTPQRQGIDPDTGKPYPTSSGYFGLTKQTSLDHGGPPDSSQATPAQQAQISINKIKADRAYLKESAGIDKPTNGQLYLAWFLGRDGAAKVLNADPNTPIEKVVGRDSIDRNPSVFRNIRTAADITDWASSKIMGVGAGWAPPAKNYLTEATTRLGLNQQEQYLYQTHLKNLYGSGGVDNVDGSRSTLMQAVVEHDGKYYSIPTVWGGKILTEKNDKGQIVPTQEAIANVENVGWDRFPSYDSPDQADKRYSQIHGYLEKDTKSYSDQRQNNALSDAARFMSESTRVKLLNAAETGMRQSEERRQKAIDKAIKQTGEAALKESYDRANGIAIDKQGNQIALTYDYIQQVKPYVSPAEYKGLIGLMQGGGAEDDPSAIIDLAKHVDGTTSEEFTKIANSYLLGNKLKTTTYTSFISKNRSAAKDDQPASPFKSGRSLVDTTLNPGQLLSGPAAQIGRSAQAQALVEYDNWSQASPNASRADAINAANGIIQRYQIVQFNNMKLSMGLSRYFGAKTRQNVTLDDINQAELKLFDDIKNSRLTDAQKDFEIKLLNDWRQIVSSSPAMIKTAPQVAPLPVAPR